MYFVLHKTYGINDCKLACNVKFEILVLKLLILYKQKTHKMNKKC